MLPYKGFTIVVQNRSVRAWLGTAVPRFAFACIQVVGVIIVAVGCHGTDKDGRDANIEMAKTKSWNTAAFDAGQVPLGITVSDLTSMLSDCKLQRIDDPTFEAITDYAPPHPSLFPAGTEEGGIRHPSVAYILDPALVERWWCKGPSGTNYEFGSVVATGAIMIFQRQVRQDRPASGSWDLGMFDRMLPLVLDKCDTPIERHKAKNRGLAGIMAIAAGVAIPVQVATCDLGFSRLVFVTSGDVPYFAAIDRSLWSKYLTTVRR